MPAEQPAAEPVAAEAPKTEEPSEPKREDQGAEDATKVETKENGQQTEKPKVSERLRRFREASEQEKQRSAQRKEQEERAREQRELQELREFRKRFSEDPVDALEKAGVSYNKLTDEYVKRLENNPGDPKLTALEKKLQDLEAQLTTSQQAARQQAEAAAVQKFENDVRVEAAKSGHLLLDAFGDEGIQIAKNLTHDFYQRHGELLTPAEAAEVTEEYLAERYKRLEAAAAKKLGKKAPAPVVKTEKQEAEPKTTTLSNDLGRSAQQEPRETNDIDEMMRWLKTQGV